MSDNAPAPMTNNEADELNTYMKMYDRLQDLRNAAGRMLTQAVEHESVAGDGRVSRELADDFAQEAAALSREMKAWRLERGYTD